MNLLFLGGDERMRYAADLLSADYDTQPHGASPDVIVLPVPLTKNSKDIFSPLSAEALPIGEIARLAPHDALILAGGECPQLSQLCREYSLRLVNYFQSETLTLRNAALTAENGLFLLMENTKGSLLGESALITGFGRIAKELAKRLTTCGCRCTIAARRREARCEAELCGYSAISTAKLAEKVAEFTFIINTVPSPLFDKAAFAEIGKESVFLELASLPESATKPLAEEFGIHYIHGGGLPGKYSPKTAGKFIAEEIQRILISDMKGLNTHRNS